MTQPTKTEWAGVASTLVQIYEFVHLRCDGYLVSASLERTGRNTLQIVVYVDGTSRGAWVQRAEKPEEIDDIPRRFCRLGRRSRMKKKELEIWEKLDGKRKCRELGRYDPIYTTSPLWNSPAAFIRHLKKHNREIEILTPQEYESAMKAKKETEDA
jgi:hypothetical protein